MEYNAKENIIDEQGLIKLKERVEILNTKMTEFANKYYRLMNLIERTDGNLDKVPVMVKNVEKKIDSLRVAIMRISNVEASNDIRLTMFEINSCETTCKLFCEKYEPILDELLDLYYQKNEIVNDRLPDANSNLNISTSNIEPISNDLMDYKKKAMEVLELFSVHGVTSSELLKYTNGKQIEYDEITKGYLNDLTYAINDLASQEIKKEDVYNLKSLLSRLGQTRLLNEESKKVVYDGVEEYINELKNRKGRIM